MSGGTWARLTLIIFVASCGNESPHGRAHLDSGLALQFEDSAVLVQADAISLRKTDGDTGEPACSPDTCNGCCDADGQCLSGTSNTLCGTGGVRCADCADGGGLCESNRCTSCTPECAGKVCGVSDGCGTSCEAGSGCCTPECRDKVCGDADGCGGTCEQGLGCCTPQCQGKACGDPDGCGGKCKAGGQCCAPKCSGKSCGDSDGCGGKCQLGSGCCTPTCSGKNCGDSDGCGGTCTEGSGCCTATCKGKICGDSDGCGATCRAGSGCCTPECSGKNCGESDGCSGKCQLGSGCCQPDCAGAICGESDSCGGTCKVGSGCCTPKCSGKICGVSQDGCGRICGKGSGCCEQTGPEVLDRTDNDCDGYTDEGFWAKPISVTFETLDTYSGCRETYYAHLITEMCTPAANLYCKDKGYVGGYGPVEMDGNKAIVVCLANATLKTVVRVSTLERLYPPCRDKEAFTPEYAYAIHLYCQDLGYYTGMGPVKDVGIYVQAICIPSGHALLRTSSPASFEADYSFCNTSDMLSVPCRAAVHRKCSAITGTETGFGMLDDKGNVLSVCLRKGPS